MIDTKILSRYSKEKSFIGNNYTSGYNFADKYYVKFDNDIRQYYIFPAGRALHRIYTFPKRALLDSVRIVLGLMLAYEDTSLSETTRADFFNKLPIEIQDYLKTEKSATDVQPEPKTELVNTDIKNIKETELATVKEPPITEPEKAEKEPIKKQKHKGGRPRTRETTGRKYVHLWINETEHEAIKQLLSTIRNKK